MDGTETNLQNTPLLYTALIATQRATETPKLGTPSAQEGGDGACVGGAHPPASDEPPRKCNRHSMATSAETGAYHSRIRWAQERAPRQRRGVERRATCPTGPSMPHRRPQHAPQVPAVPQARPQELRRSWPPIRKGVARIRVLYVWAGPLANCPHSTTPPRAHLGAAQHPDCHLLVIGFIHEFGSVL